LLQKCGKGTAVTHWKNIRKQVRKFTPEEKMWLISLFFLKGNLNCERYIILEIKTISFYFISKYYSKKLSLDHIQRRACRHPRSSCCSVSSDRQARETTSPAHKWSGSVYMKLCRRLVSILSPLLLSVYH